jgi:hypothetical protein
MKKNNEKNKHAAAYSFEIVVYLVFAFFPIHPN